LNREAAGPDRPQVGPLDPTPLAAPAESGSPTLTAPEIAHRVRAGALIVTARGVIARALGLVGVIVLARLLGPSAFGELSIGLAAVVFAGLFSDAGLGSAFVRRATPPASDDTRALVGLQVAIGAALAAATAVAAMLAGARVVGLTAVMLASTPISAFKVPGYITLERDLRYRSQFTVEVTELASYSILSISLVVLGFGVWGVAASTILRALCGLAAMSRVAPGSIRLPSWHVRRLRPVLGFGAQFQSVVVIAAIRDQGLNIGVGAIGGFSILGAWSVANRLLQVPYLLFEALWRVSFPGMARLIEVGADVRGAVERGLGQIATVTGALVCMLVAAGPTFVIVAFGEAWRPAGIILPWAGAALAVAGPISVAAAGYLFATDRAHLVLVATVIHTIVLLGIGLGLLAPLGTSALGIGLFTAGLVDAFLLGLPLRRHLGVRLGRPLSMPVAVAFAVGAGGLVLRPVLSDNVASFLALGAGALILYVVLLAVMRPVQIREILDARKSLWPSRYA